MSLLCMFCIEYGNPLSHKSNHIISYRMLSDLEHYHLTNCRPTSVYCIMLYVKNDKLSVLYKNIYNL